VISGADPESPKTVKTAGTVAKRVGQNYTDEEDILRIIQNRSQTISVKGF